VFDRATPASNTRLEDTAMSTATLTAVTLTAAASPSVRQVPSRRPASSRDRATRGLVLTPRGRRLMRVTAWVAATSVLALGLVLLWVVLAATVAPGALAGDGRPGVASGADAVNAVDVDATVEVVVGPGDTLWQIAGDHAPDRDPRSVVDDIVALNELTSTGVQAGQTLVVPTR
jgi:nucleoid-associated protein YgaU